MIEFFDSSALVKRYVAEPGSTAVTRATRSSSIVVARVTHAEVAAALARASRSNVIDAAHRDRALERLDEDVGRWRIIEIRPRVVKRARELVCAHPLRGYDAIQLAAALELRTAGAAVRVWCSDAMLSSAVTAEGLALVQPG